MLSNLLSHSAVTYNYTYGYHSSGSFPWLLWIVIIVVAIFVIACQWIVFKKAGRPGWAAIVPIYNEWVLLEMGGQPGWWALVAFIPFVGIVAVVFVIMALVEIAKRFGKSPWFALLLILLPIIGWPILAFDKSTYSEEPKGPGGTIADTPYPTSQ